MATNWKLREGKLHPVSAVLLSLWLTGSAVDVDEPASDDELTDTQSTAEAQQQEVLSPASKRAKKRATAARNKRLAKEQKAGSVNWNGEALPPPPTFVQPEPAGAPQPSSIEARLQHSAPPKKPELQRVPTLVDDGASSFSTDFEDTSLLVDGDSSSSSSENEQGIVEQPQRLEPATPKASQRSFTAAKASAAVQSTAHGALDAVASSNAIPETIAEQAEDVQETVQQNEGDAAALGASQQPLHHGSDHDPSKKWKSVVTRTVWTLIMIGGFCTLVVMGHPYLIILVIVCQALVFKEISALFDVAAKPVHHHHHSREHSRSGDKALSPTRAARDARARAERERWSKVLSW